MKYTVHAAKIPEYAQLWTPERRRLEGIQYINACDEKQWFPAPDGLLEPWNVIPCETCKLIVAHQPGRSAKRAAIRPRHQS